MNWTTQSFPWGPCELCHSHTAFLWGHLLTLRHSAAGQTALGLGLLAPSGHLVPLILSRETGLLWALTFTAPKQSVRWLQQHRGPHSWAEIRVQGLRDPEAPMSQWLRWQVVRFRVEVLQWSGFLRIQAAGSGGRRKNANFLMLLLFSIGKWEEIFLCNSE